MAVDVVHGTSGKPVASQALAKALRGQAGLSGCLFIGYPIIGTAEGPHRIDALLVSPSQGIVIFDLIEGTEVGDFGARQDDSANKLDARLRVHRELVSGRNLRINIHTISFGPGGGRAPTRNRRQLHLVPRRCGVTPNNLGTRLARVRREYPQANPLRHREHFIDPARTEAPNRSASAISWRKVSQTRTARLRPSTDNRPEQ